MAKLQNMRGLQEFIKDIRQASNKEQEQARVDKELGKIRKKFASGNVLTEYDKKKYVWKLLYIYMLGYDVEFGHRQAADLIPAKGYAEKQVGYMACAILLTEKDEFLRLVVNSIRNDLISRNEAFQCLALSFIGNVGGAEMASLLTIDVMSLVTNGAVRPIVRKKAALCLLRLLRKSPPEAELMSPDVWAPKMAALLEENDLGVLTAVVTLLLGVVSRSYEGYEMLVPRVVKLLHRLASRDVPADYTYYGIASPWLQVKCLRVLQYFPPPEEPAIIKALNETLRKIITGTEVAKNINKNNAQHAIVFEAVALALALEADTELLTGSVSLLGKFIGVREPNIKYLGLENMVRLAEVPAVIETVNRHYKAIIASLKDADVSIRRRGLDLLFAMCNPSNASEVVDELLKYLNIAELGMREELVLKTAVLAERFFPSLQWYVDVMLTLIERAGEFATRDVWHSVVQLITNHDELHEYAANKVIEALQRGAAHEALLCCAGYLLGEYGRLVASTTPLLTQFRLLHERFVAASPEAKALLLSAYMKMQLAEPGNAQLVTAIKEVFEKHSKFMDAELQQRAVEYLGLSRQLEVARRNVLAMPKWEKRKSLLLRRMAEREGEESEEVQGKPTWLQEEEYGEGGAEGGPRAEVRLDAPAGVPAGLVGDMDLIGIDGLDSTPDMHTNGGALAGANGVAVPAPHTARSPTAASDPMAALMALGLGPEPSAPPPPKPSAADPFAISGDLHGLMGGAPAEIRPTGDIGEWYRKLCTSDSGVLYEDNYLQLGIKSQFVGSQGQVMFYLGNKGEGPLERLIMAVPPAPQFALTLAPVPPRLDGKKQIQVPLTIVCTSPFLEPPVLQLSYTMAGQQCAVKLPLPAGVCKFCSPPEAPVPKDVFFSRWRALAGPPLKVSERVVRLMPVGKAPVEAMLGGLRLGVQQGLDPEPDNFVAVGTFTFSPMGQPPQQVACMLRIEVEKTQKLMLQVTVASDNVSCTAAIKDTICQLLAKL